MDVDLDNEINALDGLNDLSWIFIFTYAMA